MKDSNQYPATFPSFTTPATLELSVYPKRRVVHHRMNGFIDQRSLSRFWRQQASGLGYNTHKAVLLHDCFQLEGGNEAVLTEYLLESVLPRLRALGYKRWVFVPPTDYLFTAKQVIQYVVWLQDMGLTCSIARTPAAGWQLALAMTKDFSCAMRPSEQAQVGN